jgi:adenine-specific DNA glycosylase
MPQFSLTHTHSLSLSLALSHISRSFLEKLGQGFDYEQAANVRNVEAILTRLVSRDFRLNRDMTEKEFEALTPIERNALAFNVLMVRLRASVCVRTSVFVCVCVCVCV